MGPAPWAQQLLTLLAPHLLKHGGEQEDQEPPTQVYNYEVDDTLTMLILLFIILKKWREVNEI